MLDHTPCLENLLRNPHSILPIRSVELVTAYPANSRPSAMSTSPRDTRCGRIERFTSFTTIEEKKKEHKERLAFLPSQKVSTYPEPSKTASTSPLVDSSLATCYKIESIPGLPLSPLYSQSTFPSYARNPRETHHPLSLCRTCSS